MVDADLDARTTTKPRPPPKRWRNWWRFKQNTLLICDQCGARTPAQAGGLFSNCCKSYPSYDIARDRAKRETPDDLAWLVEWIDALPDGERP